MALADPLALALSRPYTSPAAQLALKSTHVLFGEGIGEWGEVATLSPSIKKARSDSPPLGAAESTLQHCMLSDFFRHNALIARRLERSNPRFSTAYFLFDRNVKRHRAFSMRLEKERLAVALSAGADMQC